MLTAKRSVGVTAKVNLGVLVTYTPLPSVNKADHSGLESQRRLHQKFRTEVSVAPQKMTYVLQNFNKKS